MIRMLRALVRNIDKKSKGNARNQKPFGGEMKNAFDVLMPRLNMLRKESVSLEKCQ